MTMDPTRPPRGAAIAGAAGLYRAGQLPNEALTWEIGEIIFYDSTTHTSTVNANGRKLPNVPQIKATSGGYDHLTTGTHVVICWHLGFPAILGCIDLPGEAQDAVKPFSLTGVPFAGDNDASQPRTGSHNYKPADAPSDMMPGDWAQVGSLGNHIAVLEGGVTLMGSATAHVQSLANNGMLRLSSRQLQQVTDFGIVEIKNEEGKTSYSLRAGTKQGTETGFDEQNWTIRLDMGGDNGDLLKFRITEPQGRTLFNFHVGPDGSVKMYGDGGVDISSGANGSVAHRNDVLGDKILETSGSEQHLIKGEKTLNVDGNNKTSIALSHRHSVGESETRVVGKNSTVVVTENQSYVIGGDKSLKVGGDDKTYAAGDYTAEALQTATLSGAAVKLGGNAVEPVIKGRVFGNAVIDGIQRASTFLFVSSNAASVALAAPPGPSFTAGAALGILLQGVTQAATALQEAAAAYESTLSTKVKTE